MTKMTKLILSTVLSIYAPPLCHTEDISSFTQKWVTARIARKVVTEAMKLFILGVFPPPVMGKFDLGIMLKRVVIIRQDIKVPN